MNRQQIKKILTEDSANLSQEEKQISERIGFLAGGFFFLFMGLLFFYFMAIDTLSVDIIDFIVPGMFFYLSLVLFLFGIFRQKQDLIAKINKNFGPIIFIIFGYFIGKDVISKMGISPELLFGLTTILYLTRGVVITLRKNK